MAVKQNTVRLHEDIRKEFNKISNVREFGVQKFTLEYALAVVANKFYKSPKTVENIVFNRTSTAHVTSAQGDLFTQFNQ